MKIGIVSAEPSGDLLGRKILDTLERKFPELTVHGIGDGGLNKYEISNDRSLLKIMGFVDPIMNYSSLKKFQKGLINDFIGKKIDLFIGIDSPDFNLGIHKKLQENGIELKMLAENLIQHFLRQAIRDGFFHGDMHQGNLFVDEKGNIIPVDFGIMGRLDKNNRQFLAEILYGFIQRDYVKVAEVHFKAGLVPQNASKEEFAQALRSVGEPIVGQTIKDISGGNLLAQLFEITEKFNMPTQTPLLLLQKTMVVVEGVSRKLCPETNIWQVSKPVLEDWLKSIKSPKSTLDTAINTSTEIIKRIPDFPDLMDKANYALQLMAEGKLNLGSGNNKNLEIEQMRLKNFKNNLIIGFFGIVIVVLLVF